jgi:hypothetical protein
LGVETYLIAWLYGAGQFDGVPVSFGWFRLVVPKDSGGVSFSKWSAGNRRYGLHRLYEVTDNEPLAYANVATRVLDGRSAIWEDAGWKTIWVGLVTSEADKRSLPRDRRSGCLEVGFIRESGGL